MFAQTGNCLKCGAPIYAPTVWHSITPPPAQYSCSCNSGNITVVTTNNNRNILK